MLFYFSKKNYKNKIIEPYYPVTTLGKTINYNSDSNAELSLNLVKTAQDLGLSSRIGNTVGTDDFYEAQGTFVSKI